MSLELAIQDNTRAINALIEILRNQAANPVPAEIIAAAAADAEKSAEVMEKPKAAKKTKKEAAPEPAPLEPSAPSPEPGASDAPATEVAAAPVDDAPVEPVTREQVSRALTAVASRKGRAVALGILGNVKAENLSGVKPEDYPAVLCACELALS